MWSVTPVKSAGEWFAEDADPRSLPFGVCDHRHVVLPEECKLSSTQNKYRI